MYIVDKESGCWNWALSKDRHGYGRVKRGGRVYGAHRLALMDYLGRDLLPKHVCMHLCDNRACVNPKHLKEGTQRDNVLDCIAKGRGNRTGRNSSDKSTPRSKPNKDWKIERKNKIIRLSRKYNFMEIAEKMHLAPLWVKGVIDSYSS